MLAEFSMEPLSNFSNNQTHPKFGRNTKLPKLYINHTDDIVTFGESPEDVKNKCNDIIEDLKSKHNLETEIQYSDIIPEIISPWK